VIAPRLARVAQTPLKLIGVFPQVVQKSGCVALLFGPKGRGKSAGLLCHAPQVLAQGFWNARPVGIGAVPEELITRHAFATRLHRPLPRAAVLGVCAAALAIASSLMTGTVQSTAIVWDVNRPKRHIT
jgi:hypothetical protein